MQERIGGLRKKIQVTQRNILMPILDLGLMKEKNQEDEIVITNSIPKLLQEAGEVRQALEAIGKGLPSEISAAAMGAKITELDANNVERTQLFNLNKDKAKVVSDYIA